MHYVLRQKVRKFPIFHSVWLSLVAADSQCGKNQSLDIKNVFALQKLNILLRKTHTSVIASLAMVSRYGLGEKSVGRDILGANCVKRTIEVSELAGFQDKDSGIIQYRKLGNYFVEWEE